MWVIISVTFKQNTFAWRNYFLTKLKSLISDFLGSASDTSTVELTNIIQWSVMICCIILVKYTSVNIVGPTMSLQRAISSMKILVLFCHDIYKKYVGSYYCATSNHDSKLWKFCSWWSHLWDHIIWSLDDGVGRYEMMCIC